ncbi:MAG: enoyl-CoA hydratase/isomerase family protein [Phycisphaerales bacterium]|nr:enoyl-CoA hydratase/isomerase family protein [Phycisphaerales bacterium]
MISTRLEGDGDSAIGLVTLARPDKRNALTPEMLTALRHAVNDLAPAVGAIVLEGERSGDRNVFCAGFDLSLCQGNDGDSVLEAMLVGLSAAVRTLRSAEVPIVAAAAGAAVAGGCALLGGCDIVVTDSQSKIGYPVVKLGISPAVSAATLRTLIGEGRARERLLDPAVITGAEAGRIGLAHEVMASSAEVAPRAAAIARELAAKPRAGIVATKSWLNQLDGSIDARWADRTLAASLSLVGGIEQHRLLPQAWSR